MPLWKPNDFSGLTLWLTAKDIEIIIARGGTITRWKNRAADTPDYGKTSPMDMVSLGDRPTSGNGKPTGGNSSQPDVIFQGTGNGGFQPEDTDDDGTADEGTGDTGGPADFGTNAFYFGMLCTSGTSNAVEVAFAHDTIQSAFECRHNGSNYVFDLGTTGTAGVGRFHVGKSNQAIPVSDGDTDFVSVEKRSNFSGTGTVAAHEVNGGPDTSTDSPPNTSFSENLNDAGVIQIGRRNNASDKKEWSGSIREIIIYQAETDSSKKDVISGYVLHRFGLDSKLVNGHGGSTHTYKYGPPTTCNAVSEGNLSTSMLTSVPVDQYELSEELNTFCETRK